MDILQLLISGIANGCVYGLIALGFVIIYKATEAVNFAQGDFMMLGAFVALGLTNDQFMNLPFWISVPAAILSVCSAKAGRTSTAERFLKRPSNQMRQILSFNSGMPDMVAVRAASLDDPTLFEPMLVVFTETAQPWDTLDEGLPSFSRMPEMMPDA